MMTRTEDRQLLEGLRAGDPAALRRLAELYAPRIHRLAIRHVKNHEDAEEVTQDVLLKVHRKVGAFRGDSALSSWIYRITFNTAMSRLRRRRVRAAIDRLERSTSPSEPTEGTLPDRPDWSGMPDERVLRSELRGAVAAAVQALPEMYRDPVVLRDLRGLTTEEASSRLRLKDQTLKSRLRRGRIMLRGRLGSFADGLSLHRPTTPAYS